MLIIYNTMGMPHLTITVNYKHAPCTIQLVYAYAQILYQVTFLSHPEYVLAV